MKKVFLYYLLAVAWDISGMHTSNNQDFVQNGERWTNNWSRGGRGANGSRPNYLLAVAWDISGTSTNNWGVGVANGPRPIPGIDSIMPQNGVDMIDVLNGMTRVHIFPNEVSPQNTPTGLPCISYSNYDPFLTDYTIPSLFQSPNASANHSDDLEHHESRMRDIFDSASDSPLTSANPSDCSEQDVEVLGA